MLDIVIAIAPVFLLIVAGTVIQATDWVPEAFWESADKLTYYVFLPALLVYSIATANLSEVMFGNGIFVAVVAVLLITALLYAKRRIFNLPGPTFAAVVQGSIRPNTYIGIAVALALYADHAFGPIAVAILAYIPLVNVISTLTLIHYGHKPEDGHHRLPGLRILLNPLILACVAGIAINLIDRGLPPVAASLLDILGRAALPLGLLSVGAGLDLRIIRGPGRRVMMQLAGGMKLAVLPLVVLVLFNLFGIHGVTPAVIAIFAAAPASVSSYILARQMGGDAPLMSAIISTETLAAFVTLPLWLFLKDFLV